MRRRAFIAGLGSAAAWPVVARAQQAAMPVVGFLNLNSPELFGDYIAAFKLGLNQTGFVESQNVTLEYRWARGDYNQLSALANELVNRQVAVIAANGGSRSALAAKAATAKIRIVFTFGDGDPVNHGLVESINHPGGNITGVTMIAGLLEPKRLELLRDLVPDTVVYILVNPNNGGVLQDIPTVAAAAGKLGLELKVVKAGTESEIDAAFEMLAQAHAQALMVANDGILQFHAPQIISLATRYSLPAIYPWREYVVAGGLMSYGASIREAYRQSGSYVGQILSGANVAELPVLQSTKFEFVINLRAAKAVGLEIPPTLLARADEVIE